MYKAGYDFLQTDFSMYTCINIILDLYQEKENIRNSFVFQLLKLSKLTLV